MTPNHSHVAGLELALDALQDAHSWVGSAVVRKLIEQAKAAPAEADEGEAFCDGHCTWLDHQHGCPMADPTEAVEVVAHMWQHDETGRVGFVDQQQVDWGFEKNNPRLHLCGELMTVAQHKRLMANHSADDLNMVKVPRELALRAVTMFDMDEPIYSHDAEDLRALLGGAG